jgi:hypothetical protein
MFGAIAGAGAEGARGEIIGIGAETGAGVILGVIAGGVDGVGI